MKVFCSAAFLVVLLAVSACNHSHVIQVNVTNASNEKVSTVVIDYPEATFGINSLEPGKSFQYKIKPTANGALKIAFRNARGMSREAAGPVVNKNDEGTIEIKLTQDSAVSEPKLAGK